MKWAYLLLIILVSFFWIHPEVAADSTLRCKNRLVSDGDTQAAVLAKCGNPDQVIHWEEDHNSHFSQLYDYENDRYQAPTVTKGPIRMERWTYNFGSNKFKRYLHFENGRLIKIETRDKSRD
jgi:hypothetical protein